MSQFRRLIVRLALTAGFALSTVACAAIVGIEDATEWPVDGSGADDGGIGPDGSLSPGPDGSAGDASAADVGDASKVPPDTSAIEVSTPVSDATGNSPPDGTVAEASTDAAPIADATLDVGDSTREESDAAQDSGSSRGIDGAVDGALDAGSADGSVDSSDAAANGDCSIRSYDDGLGIFVTTAGTDELGCGTRAEPCLTVTNAVSQANAVGKAIVYVATGTYTESLDLAHSVTIEGAWSATGSAWTPACSSNDATVIQAPSSALAAVVVGSINGTATLRWLQIMAAPAATVPPSQSSYGIMALGPTTTLSLEAVTVMASRGGDGAAGSVGGTGTAATDAGCVSDGSTAAPGEAGPSSTGGLFTANGYESGDGVVGAGGLAGGSGASGGTVECASCGSCLASHCEYAANGAGTVCGSPGLAGCGGGGGGGGGGGTGGGSSIALYVWDATVTSQDCSFVAGPGGAGGPGGPGGGGGAPSSGVAGAPAECLLSCSFPIMDGGGCTSSYAVENGGSAGGMGQSGGAGGAGGGGAGGWSCGAYVGGAGSLTDFGSTFSASDAGAGGSPAGALGASSGRCPP